MSHSSTYFLSPPDSPFPGGSGKAEANLLNVFPFPVGTASGLSVEGAGTVPLKEEGSCAYGSGGLAASLAPAVHSGQQLAPTRSFLRGVREHLHPPRSLVAEDSCCP